VSDAEVSLDPEPIEFPGTGGITLRGDRWTGAGWEKLPDVMMLPGGGQTRHSWKTAGLELARRGFRVTSMDTRGHGDSDWSPQADYDITTLAADAIGVIRALGRPTVLVGASMGGLTGILAAPQVGPEHLCALVLVDVVPRVERGGSARIHQFMVGGLDGFETLDEAADAIAAYLPHRPRPKNNDGLLRNLRKREDGRWYWHWDPAFVTQPREVGPIERVAEMQRAAASITVPVLLLRGKLSDIVSDEGVEEFRALVPQVEVVVLPRAAHTAAGDDNEAFAAAVIDFVSGPVIRSQIG
jgi:pimeloyl-ACP methyl ester carboxylesterase